MFMDFLQLPPSGQKTKQTKHDHLYISSLEGMHNHCMQVKETFLKNPKNNKGQGHNHNDHNHVISSHSK